jgi:hypothetical protein
MSPLIPFLDEDPLAGRNRRPHAVSPLDLPDVHPMLASRPLFLRLSMQDASQ